MCRLAEFKGKPVFVFFNKKDVLSQELAVRSLSSVFSDFAGGESELDAIEWMQARFREIYVRARGSDTNLHMLCLSTRTRVEVREAFKEVARTSFGGLRGQLRVETKGLPPHAPASRCCLGGAVTPLSESHRESLTRQRRFSK